jgi:hypothetical protein
MEFQVLKVSLIDHQIYLHLVEFFGMENLLQFVHLVVMHLKYFDCMLEILLHKYLNQIVN